MGKIIEETTNSQQEIKQQFVEFGETMKRQLQSQSEMIDKINRAGTILGESLDGLETISQKLKSSAGDIGSAAKLLEHSSNAAKEGHESMKQTVEMQIQSMIKTREDLNEVWQDITGNVSQLVSQISQTVHELNEGIGTNLIKALTSFDGKVSEVVERFSGTLSEAGDTISAMPEFIKDINESLDAVKQSVAAMGGTIENIREISEGIVSENLEKAYDASKMLDTVTQKANDTSNDIQHFFETFHEKNSSNAEIFHQGNRQSIVEFKQILIDLSDKVVEIKNTIPAFSNFETIIENIENDNGDKNNSEMLKQLSDIHLHIKDISSGFMDHMFPGIEKLNSSINNMVLSLAELKNYSEREDDTAHFPHPF